MTRQVIRDPALPGLEKAMRREITPCLSAALGEASGGAWSVLGATPVRLRYRPGKRAIVQYALALSGPPGELSTPAALWFFAGGKAAKLARRIAAPPAIVSMPPPAVLEPVTGGLLQVFPYDHRVPQIAAFLNDSGAFAYDLFAEPDVAADAPELARFRPGLGATFRWRRAEGPQVYVKINPAKSPARARALLESLHRAAPHSGFATPRPAGSAAAIAALSIEAIEGPDFGGILATGQLPEIEAAARRTARALAGFHHCAVVVTNKKDRGFLARRAAAAAASIGATGARPGHSARRLADWIARTSAPLRPGLAHMDMKPEHLIITDGAITLLDLDSVARSDGLYDIAMLEMRIHSTCASGSCDTDQANAAIRALHDSYPGNGDACWARRHAWLRACAALQVAKHHAQNLADGWRERVARLLHAGRPDVQPNLANPASVAREGSA